ncbi:MAG: hypothetical protein GWP20_01705, partial [Thermotogales bacterium]|nr:hypothetical protein [Thermotogales bacterium]
MHLPAWVFWLAQDEGGAWWGYEAEPLQFHNGWYENEVGRRLLGLFASPEQRDVLDKVQALMS